MLDDYKDKQSVAYNILINEIKNNTVTHAYLIDENRNSEAFNFVMAFVKSILCSSNNTNNDNCINCSLCKRIDDGNYPEIKIIKADGMYIKKKQIIDLQQEFSRAAIEGGKRIYIIRDCDKMRPEAANSMLKFLEEPDNNIIAILMTNNYNNILPTIISRCQIIKLNNDIINTYDLEYVEVAFNFIYSIENKGIRTILDESKLWFDKINSKDREKMMLVFDIMIDMYYDIIKLKLGMSDVKYIDYRNEFLRIADINLEYKILSKVNYLVNAKDSIKYNVNSNLLIDSLIINIGGSYEGSWS